MPASAWSLIRNPVSTFYEADIGYELAPDAWGHGCATEPRGPSFVFGFQELGLHRISADTVADNTGLGPRAAKGWPDAGGPPAR